MRRASFTERASIGAVRSSRPSAWVSVKITFRIVPQRTRVVALTRRGTTVATSLATSGRFSFVRVASASATDCDRRQWATVCRVLLGHRRFRISTQCAIVNVV
jgi:hypothetical protein